jgi:beta-phosphoglucomutase-like phosphatase (HAD superfamily)
MPDTAVFDIDGTLIDTNYRHALAWLVTSLSPTSRATRSRRSTGQLLVRSTCLPAGGVPA